MYVEYSSNNSGGSWWLEDQDWRSLEAGGWKVEWARLENLYDEKGSYVRDEDGTPKLVPVEQGNSKFGALFNRENDGDYRYMGALAKKAYRVGLSLLEAAAEWEKLTGKSSTDAGCPCCGQPHNFTEYDDDGKYVKSGPDTHYEARW